MCLCRTCNFKGKRQGNSKDGSRWTWALQNTNRFRGKFGFAGFLCGCWALYQSPQWGAELCTQRSLCQLFQWEHSDPTKCWKCGPICWICGRAPWSSPPCCSPPLITFAITFRCLQGNKTVAQCDKRKWFISWFAARTAVKHCVDSYFLHQQWQNQREARKETERAPHVSTQCLLDGGATYVASKRYAEGNEGWWVCWVDGWPWCS